MNRLREYLQAQRFSKDASKRENGVWFSEPEIRLCEALTERGFRFVQQKRLKIGASTVILDFLVEDTLGLEVDGREFHDMIDDQHRDFFVYREHGIWTMRVPGWRAMREPENVVSAVALKLSELCIRRERVA